MFIVSGKSGIQKKKNYNRFNFIVPFHLFMKLHNFEVQKICRFIKIEKLNFQTVYLSEVHIFLGWKS